MSGAAAGVVSHGVDLEAGRPEVPCLGKCWGRSWDIRDYMMGVGHAVSLTGIIASLGTRNFYFAIGFGVTEVFGVIGHGLVRKYGDLSAIVERFQQAAQGYNEAIQRREALIQDSKATIDHLSGMVDRIGKEKGDLEGTRDALQDEVKRVHVEATSIRERCTRLEETVAMLKAQIAELQRLIAESRNELTKFSAENASLKELLSQISQEERKLDQGVSEIKADAGLLGQGVASLAHEVPHIQAAATEMHALLVEQSEVLSAKVSGLSEIVREISHLEGGLEGRVGELATLQREVEITESDLLKVHSGFQEVISRVQEGMGIIRRGQETLLKHLEDSQAASIKRIQEIRGL